MMPPMYLVGTRRGTCQLISDGSNLYVCAQGFDELAALTQEPNAYPHRGRHPVTRISGTFADAEDYCRQHGLRPRRQRSQIEYRARVSATSLAIGGAAALLVAPCFAISVALIAGWVAASLGAPLLSAELEARFRGAERAHANYERSLSQERIAELERTKQLAQQARESWGRYFRLRNLAALDELDGADFENAVAELYERLGYEVQVTPASGDFGVDVLARKGPELLAIQVKRYQGSVGVDAVQQAASGATYYKATRAVVVTNSIFTRPAFEMAKKVRVLLVDRKELALLWHRAYPDEVIPPFDPVAYERLKGEIQRTLSRVNRSRHRLKRKR